MCFAIGMSAFLVMGCEKEKVQFIETLTGPIDYKPALASIAQVSPNGKHICVVEERGGVRRYVNINCQQSERFDDIVEEGVIFSENSAHYAFRARLGDRWYVVADGEKGVADLIHGPLCGFAPLKCARAHHF